MAYWSAGLRATTSLWPEIESSNTDSAVEDTNCLYPQIMWSGLELVALCLLNAGLRDSTETPVEARTAADSPIGGTTALRLVSFRAAIFAVGYASSVVALPCRVPQ